MNALRSAIESLIVQSAGARSSDSKSEKSPVAHWRILKDQRKPWQVDDTSGNLSFATVVPHEAEQRQLYLRSDADLLLIGISSWLVIDKIPAPVQTRELDNQWFSIRLVRLNQGLNVEHDLPSQNFHFGQIWDKAGNAPDKERSELLLMILLLEQVRHHSKGIEPDVVFGCIGGTGRQDAHGHLRRDAA
jgi:hypothetical protein